MLDLPKMPRLQEMARRVQYSDEPGGFAEKAFDQEAWQQRQHGRAFYDQESVRGPHDSVAKGEPWG